MEHWLTIEVFSAAGQPAAGWMRGWHDSIIETALASGIDFWDSHEHAWGVVLEFAFPDEQARDRFRDHPALRAALDATPNPVNGVLVYPHRGGGSGSCEPRRPRPAPGAGAVELPAAEPMPFTAAVSCDTYLPTSLSAPARHPVSGACL